MVFAPFGKEKGKESFLSAQDYKTKFSAFRWLPENKSLSWQAVERKWLLMPEHLGPKGFERLERMRERNFSRMIIRSRAEETRKRAERITETAKRYGLKPK
ncbi:MAG: hypothetical protein ABH986_00080 [archaeon]